MTSVNVRIFSFEEDLFDFPSRFEARIKHYRTQHPEFIGYGENVEEAVSHAVKIYKDAKDQDERLDRWERVNKTSKEVGSVEVDL